MSGDPRDLGQAYEQHREKLRSLFRSSLRESNAADDLVQELYLTLARFPPREPLRDPSAYLYKIAWHLLQRFNKRARRAPETADHETLERLSQRSAEDASAELEAEQHLLALLKELPPLYGAVLLLSRRDGMNYSQIAARLNISTSQVRRYLGHTLLHLKKASWND
jgi:RNA polymerase sigma-70 factor (ECF subfamily)